MKLDTSRNLLSDDVTAAFPVSTGAASHAQRSKFVLPSDSAILDAWASASPAERRTDLRLLRSLGDNKEKRDAVEKRIFARLRRRPRLGRRTHAARAGVAIETLAAHAQGIGTDLSVDVDGWMSSVEWGGWTSRGLTAVMVAILENAPKADRERLLARIENDLLIETKFMATAEREEELLAAGVCEHRAGVRAEFDCGVAPWAGDRGRCDVCGDRGQGKI